MRKNRFSLVGMQLPEKYKDKLDVSREGPAEMSGAEVKKMLSRDRFYILSIKAHVIFPTPATNFPPKPPSLETSNFTLYFSHSCIS